ncbi:hypothetical protein EON66_04275 [archaeon]|nr:MAG: hypothetical protein EON66_04275 [archaeon]
MYAACLASVVVICAAQGCACERSEWGQITCKMDAAEAELPLYLAARRARACPRTRIKLLLPTTYVCCAS